MRISTDPVQPQPDLDLPDDPNTTWFAARSCVVVKGDRREVFVGGSLIGSFGRGDSGSRNILLVLLAEEPDVHLGQLANGFGVTFETLRRMRKLYESEGVEALVLRKHGGSTSEFSAAVVRRAEALFEKGASVSEVTRSLGRNGPSRSGVGRLRKAWAERTGAPASTAELPSRPRAELAAETPEVAEAEPSELRIAARPPESASGVQHLGSWLLLGAVHQLGLYAAVNGVGAFGGGAPKAEPLRIAIDTFATALAIGERCVEGSRRLATPEASALVRATHAPSPTWVRRVLGQFSTPARAGMLQMAMGHQYLARAAAEADGEEPVFYVDNHLRPYTGKEVLRRGWRMQDKRVRPGATDFYVHDEDGRPVLRHTSPQHASLTALLTPVGEQLRAALPKGTTVLLAFDRAGAYAAQMAELRDAGLEFVTYERRPYPLLAPTEFTEELHLGDERLRWCEPRRRNLGLGRGRVRRICIRTEDGRQVNLVAISKRPAEGLIEVMRGRWVQENAFKHGNERWGINQLDGRVVVPYAPETVIPNPARRRLDEALRVLRAKEGLLRVELARLPEGDARRAKLVAEAQAAQKNQEDLLALRPETPARVALSETPLNGVLVHHRAEYKQVLDTVRIACANAEADLAVLLARHVRRPKEAKKLLACLFAAPGSVRITKRAIHVTLAPAANASEQRAIGSFLVEVNGRGLTLPGDQNRRPLRVRLSQLR